MDLFFERFRHFHDIGAVASSSRFLADKIIELADIPHCSSIVEIGPGTGVFTKEIQKQIQPHQKFFTVEKDQIFFDHIQIVYPEVTHYNCCASMLNTCMKQEGICSADCIISSLPWALFDDALQDKLMSALYESLRPGGIMLTFTYLQSRYLPKGISCKKKLETYFGSVEESDIVWLNLPPAFVYVCKK